MPKLDWLKREFNYGYSSGNVLSLIPSLVRFREEKRIGGSYRKVFFNAVLPNISPDSLVLELGPGRGSWSKAILKYIPEGVLHTVDFQDVSKWLKPENYNGRLVNHKVENNDFTCVEDGTFDFFWSFGVLCHNNKDNILEVLRNALPKMKLGGIAVLQHSDWDKLDIYGWKKGAIPLEFRNKPDDEIWWPRNSKETMVNLAMQAGWTVVCDDLDLVKRDSITVLKRK